MKPHARTAVFFVAASTLAVAALALAAVRIPATKAEPGPTVATRPQPAEAPAATPVPTVAGKVGDARIQLALLLDTSSSMSGLIDQAKSQLWKVVNEFSAMRRADGSRPRLEIALYEYGKSSLPSEDGWIRRILPLTTDLDRISEELFALDTNGGDEYCGQVIHRASRELEWSANPDDLKFVFIAGNEPFDQGPVRPATAVAAAKEKGIVVNTIHCGGQDESWKKGALLAGGRFLTIDHNRVVEYVRAPQDDQIAQLGAALNKTYVPFGDQGSLGAQRQAAQDSNSGRSSFGSLVTRSISKASSNYSSSNAHWDLVDAVETRKVDLAKVDAASLPAEMQGMNAEQRVAHVEQQRAERQRLQAQINALNAERTRYLAEQSARKGAGEEATLDAAMIRTVREQAAKSGYLFN